MELPKRSKLNSRDVIKWLNSRFNNVNRRNDHYLYSPDQLLREKQIQKIFLQFDSDGSGGLSRQQIYSMFQGFGMDMPIEKLNWLYDSVEQNLAELNLEKFKQCALSQKSNRVFREIIKSLNCDQYMPTKFTEMITYLVYLSKRQELKKKVENAQLNGEQRINSMASILRLKELANNNKQINLNLIQLKNKLYHRFKQLWKVTEDELKIQQFKITKQLLKQIKQRYQQRMKCPQSIGVIPYKKYFTEMNFHKSDIKKIRKVKKKFCSTLQSEQY